MQTCYGSFEPGVVLLPGQVSYTFAIELNRSRYWGVERAFTWSGEGVLAHNLTRAALWLLALAPAHT